MGNSDRALFVGLGLVVFVAGSVMMTGCTAPAAQTPATVPATAVPVTTTTTSTMTAAQTAITAATSTADQFASATMLSVMTVGKNWDADADDDGIVIWPAIVTASNSYVPWTGLQLPVDIEIYTTRYENNQGFVKDSVVYRGQGTLNSWRDAEFYKGSGIRVSFDQMTAPPNERFGETLATVHLPDGRTFAAKNLATRIKP